MFYRKELKIGICGLGVRGHMTRIVASVSCSLLLLRELFVTDLPDVCLIDLFSDQYETIALHENFNRYEHVAVETTGFYSNLPFWSIEAQFNVFLFNIYFINF